MNLFIEEYFTPYSVNLNLEIIFQKNKINTDKCNNKFRNNIFIILKI
jgi:hypothetical protein